MYQAVVWFVLSYGLPLWYRLNGKGCQSHLKMLNKTQNVALHWICSAFRTMPIPWMEFIAGVLPVKQKVNYMLRNALQRASRVLVHHVLHHIAASPVAQDIPVGRPNQCPRTDSWMQQCLLDSDNATAIGTDGSYCIKGQGLAPSLYNVMASCFTLTAA